MRRPSAPALLVALPALLWLAQAPASLAGNVHPATDSQGRPLLSPDGERLVYGVDLSSPEGRDPRPAPGLPTPPPRPLAVDPALMRDDGTIGSYAQVLGRAGIHAFDADGDGQQEILVGHTMMWYLLTYEPDTNGYVQAYFHETGTGGTFSGGGIVEVAPGDIDGDGTLEVVVLRENGSIDVHDARTGLREGTQSLGVTTPVGLALANTEGGSQDEIVVINSSTLSVFRYGTAGALWTLAGSGGVDVTTGSMDADAAVEIGIARGNAVAGHVVDATSRTIQWNNATGFGNYVDAGDVDGDGRDELAMVEEWNDYEVWDVEITSRKWFGPNFNSSAIRVVDADGDGLAEVLIGDKQWGDVLIFDGVTGTQRAAIANPEHSVAYVDVGDPDRDCRLDVIWGAGYTSTGEDHLYVADIGTRTREWENIENDGFMHSFVVTDADGDGATDIIRGCNESNAGYDGSRVFVTDFHHRRDTRIPAAAANDGWMVTRGMATAQLDADAAAEYVMNDSRTYTGKVSAFDGVTHAIQWSSAGYNGENVQSVAVGDVDGDTLPEVAWGSGKETTGATGIFVRLLRGTDGSQLWQSASLSGGFDEVLDLRLANVDADAAGEIVAIINPVGVRVWDGVTRVQEWSLAMTDVTALEVGDVDDDGDDDIVLGRANGTLVAHDGTTHAQLFSQSVSTQAIHAIRIGDVDQDAIPDIVMTQGASDSSTVQIRAASDRSLLWESPTLAGQAGSASSLVLADADDDQLLEIVVSTSHALRIFEYADASADILAPVWDGAVGVVALSRLASPACCPAVDVSWDSASDGQSPPITYEVHRSTTPTFVPGAGNRIATTSLMSLRDESVNAATTYYYVVRAVDRAGNRETNSIERSILTISLAPPTAPTSVTATDLDGCLRNGVEITFAHDGLPAGVTYDLYRDGVRVATGIVSPHAHTPGNGAPHDYAVEAVHPSCPFTARSVVARASDLSSTPAAPVIDSVTDTDPCVPGSLRITFTHPGLPTGHFELLVDGVVVNASVTSPATHAPGDLIAHDYAVRAVDDTCGTSATSVVVQASDAERVVAPATITAITDTDTCAASSARVTFTHPGFPGAGHHELWRDGVPHQSPIASGDTFPTIDLASHDYEIVAVDDECSMSRRADATVAHADDAGTGTAPSAVTLTDLAPCTASSARLTFSHPGFSGAGHHELWRDGVPFLSPVATGAVFFPGDQLAHDWLVRAVDETCGSSADSPLLSYADGLSAPPAAVITSITDADACAASLLVLSFTHAGFGAATGHHDLLQDGVLLVAGVVDGSSFAPGDALSHDYVVRSTDDDCSVSVDSAPRAALDGVISVEAPVINAITDPDPCSASGLALEFTHAGFGASAGRYDLYEDGVLVASDISSPHAVAANPGAARDHVVRAINVTCGLSADSPVVTAMDGAASCVPGTSTVLVIREAAGLALSWTAATDAASYNAYVGTLASLWSLRVQDHVKTMAGLTFPDAASPLSGCDVASGPSLAARVQGLPATNFYFLLVAAGPTGIEGSYGTRSIAPFERHDAANDPRPAATFCP